MILLIMTGFQALNVNGDINLFITTHWKIITTFDIIFNFSEHEKATG